MILIHAKLTLASALGTAGWMVNDEAFLLLVGLNAFPLAVARLSIAIRQI